MGSTSRCLGRGAALALAGGLLLGWGTASAQETQLAKASGSPVVQLEEIRVTATKIEKPASLLTETVTVVDEEEIKEGGYTDLTDVLRYTPSVQFKRAGGPGQYVYTKMRGYGDGNFVVTIDGMRINESMSAGTGNLFSKLDPFLIERVEILRGPQAALYGSDTTAGALAFTTKGGYPGANGTVGAEYGTYDWLKAYAGIRGEQDGLRYAINAAAVDSEGVQAYEDFHNLSPQVKLGWGKGDKFDAEFSYLHIQSKWNYSDLIENYNKVKTLSEAYAFQLGDPDRYLREDYDLATLNLKHKLNEEFRQKLMLGWYKKKTEGNNPYNGLLGYITSPSDNFTVDYVNYYRKGQSVPVYDDGTGQPYYYENQNYQADYNLIWERQFGAVKNTALLGLNLTLQEGRRWGLYGDMDGNLDTRSVYLNDQLLLLDEALVLSGGVRYDDNQEFEDEATYKVGAAYTFKTVGTTLFSNYGTSFRQPTIANLYDPKYGNKDLQPEKGWMAEAGVRQELLDKKLRLEAVAWKSELKDVITFEYLTALTGHYVNRDEQRTQGVEFSFLWNLYGPFHLLGGYTYTDSEIDNDGVTSRTVQIARNVFNLGLEYQPDQKLSLGIHAYYQGPRLRWNGDVEYEEYTRFDLYGRYKFYDGLSIYTRVNNLFDERYYEDPYEQPGLYVIAGLSWDFNLGI